MITTRKDRSSFYKLCHRVSNLNEEGIEALAQALVDLPLNDGYGQHLVDYNSGESLIGTPSIQNNSPSQLTPPSIPTQPQSQPQNQQVTPVIQNPVETKEEHRSLFPVTTFDGETIPERKFQHWVTNNISDYINSTVEELRMKGDYSSEELLKYVESKGWSQFVNNFNPVKVFISKDNQDRYIDYAREFQRQTGKTLKEVFRSRARKLLRNY